jgi:putative ABC transport system permease protein
VRHEAVIPALPGAAIGILLAVMVGIAIGVQGVTIPVGTLIIFVVAAIIAGLIAAIFPARRAGRLDVLAALQYE